VEVLFQAAVLLEADGREVPPAVLDTLVTAARAGLAGPLTDSRIQATLPMACR
jgi:predicted naringenin-chalcone synthase